MTDFNVQSYGAMGDGTHPDYEGIQAAAEAAIAAKGRLLFPPTAAFYSVWQGITLGAPDGLTISGHGATIRLSGDSLDQARGRVLHFDRPGPRNILIEGLTIDGNGAAQTTNSPDDRAQRSGIFMSGSENIRVIGVTVQSVSGDGFQFHGAGGRSNTRVHITGCRWDTCGRHLCSFTDADGIIVDSCFGATAQQGGIHFEAEGGAPLMRRIRISGNVLEDVGRRKRSNLDGCITIAGSPDSERARDVVIVGNVCVGQGIVVIGPRLCTIQGNTVTNARGTGADGIAIQVRSAGVTIDSNVIEAPSQFGIAIDNSGRGAGSTHGQSLGTITGNAIRNLADNPATSEGIRLGATRAAAVEGNTIVNDAPTKNTFGIRLVGGAIGAETDGNVVSHNVIVNCVYGIVEDRFSRNNQLLDNRITGSTAQAYSLSGTNTSLSSGRGVGANVGDGSTTVVHGVDPALVLFASPVTAERTVTLSGVNATPGARFRVVRTAWATGEPAVSVGGLKNLTAGQWADVEFSPSDGWFLSGFGSL